jgi:predicted metal-binding membrane protein
MSELAHDHALTHLTAAETRLSAVLMRPMAITFACVAVLSALGWATLGFTMAVPERSWLDALCRPSLGGALTALDVVLVLAMWAAMTLAMMLPTTGPMILTYAELADTAARKGERIISPLVLTAGYITVWLGFAVLATALQVTLATIAQLDLTRAETPISGMIFFAVGLYQFSVLKQACLTQCQHPFPFFLANWTTQLRGVFQLGLRQGLNCLGCCWALMLIMFAVGAMNVIWMAALGAIMAIEKIAPDTRFAHMVGFTFIAIGAILVLSVMP